MPFESIKKLRQIVAKRRYDFNLIKGVMNQGPNLDATERDIRSWELLLAHLDEQGCLQAKAAEGKRYNDAIQSEHRDTEYGRRRNRNAAYS